MIESGTYVIASKKDPHKMLDMASASTSNGGNAQLYDSNGTDAQCWRIRSAGDGWYTLTSCNSALRLDIANGSGSSGANVQQWSATAPKPRDGASLWARRACKSFPLLVWCSMCGVLARRAARTSMPTSTTVLLPRPGASLRLRPRQRLTIRTTRGSSGWVLGTCGPRAPEPSVTRRLRVSRSMLRARIASRR